MATSNRGASRLAGVLSQHITNMTDRPAQIEGGVVLQGKALQLDHFTVPIPAGEYLLDEGLTVYSVELGRQVSRLEPGDRVWCCWLNESDVLVCGRMVRLNG